MGDTVGRSNLASRNAQRLNRDKLEGAPGYVSSGEGEWSRKAASTGNPGSFRPVRHHGYGKPLMLQIAETERRILRMECELRLCEQRHAIKLKAEGAAADQGAAVNQVAAE